MSIAFAGTVLSDYMTNFKPDLYIRNETTGHETKIHSYMPDFNLYKDETFCLDTYSEYDYIDIRDNTTYTLIIK